ncbi:2-succinyl-5-enolpyruvyl-6-hydroxy-3-cyclohexene-1-carboxylic-acid synthase [Microbacterium sp. LRZ72]|uniref:2-succinyl-5-enolpyruvyl-6-hydroxy-3- cyclohexene-1-carboxylic-acid synthase n=1 Tax=Microbacterium sp. LRZ72 TaxID=2942481 RepID=UPI0029A34C01|nr:2-succinyl-5-enolpyruvyl-6-hydroxy-3-cyclohexene-1-carboxylic-acid synthase [Microbacterium sp. LRZ72]MDX2377320.1 2-succinyl-5-enolpyruvyl-6-hydroxy-3-cyclohexene-1-carboxylic-acid synthase [Microbacterium sp. LRZ72]
MGSVSSADADRAPASPATDAAAVLIHALISRGLRDVVLSPGSRSQALALVVAELEQRDAIDLHVRIDERVAGFTALGIARESRRPVAVICTSGTAVANLMPALLEAHHAGVPLLLLTADRPPELRGVGANQTTRQPGIFGQAVRYALDAPVPERREPDGDGEQSATFAAIADEAWDAAAGVGSGDPGPAHVNLPFREPLAGASPAWLTASAAVEWASPDDDTSGALYQGGGGIGGLGAADAEESTTLLPRGPRTVVVAGADAGADAEALSHAGGWPLVAEIVSGARFGRLMVHGYRELLSDPELGGAVERVVVFGRPTLSREVVALLSRDDVEVIAMHRGGERINLNGATACVWAVAVEPGETDRAWLGAWMTASQAQTVDLAPAAPDAEGLASTDPRVKRRALDAELEAVRRPLDRATLVDAVWRATWPHDRLVFGSSRLVRVADRMLPGKKVPVHANRGVAGIDGTIATASGVAIASQRSAGVGTTRVLLGDLALLHDVGALSVTPGEDELRLQVIVGNDGGGTIFDGLEVAAMADAAAMERVLYTPQRVDLAQLAAAYGWGYVRATTRGELDQALTAASPARVLIEVPLPR